MPTHHRLFTRSLALVALAAVTLPGCLPTKLVIDLAPGDGRLDETTVLADRRDSASLSKVAQIDLTGLISQTSAPALFGTQPNAVDQFVARLKKAEEDPEVRAVVLRINSPGGTVAASEVIYKEIHGFRERSGKPVVASFAEVAASGGYYSALAADHIVAQSTSITGSIGVIFQTFNFSRGMSMIGVEGRALVSRPNKDLANPFEPPVESQYAVLQVMVDEFYESFVNLAKDRRPSLVEKGATAIDTATDGRVVTGMQALELGLVDEIGGMREAFASAKRLAGINEARLVKYHPQGSMRPSSPYAAADFLQQGSLAGTGVPEKQQVNLVQLNLASESSPGATFYYLWTP